MAAATTLIEVGDSDSAMYVTDEVGEQAPVGPGRWAVDAPNPAAVTAMNSATVTGVPGAIRATNRDGYPRAAAGGIDRTEQPFGDLVVLTVFPVLAA
jgi:hypothetical protein